MDGIHDLGGRQGFGPVAVDEPEEPFHAPWEGRVYGIVRSLRRAPGWSLDWFRFCRELIEPVDYLTRPYYDQWAQSWAAILIASGYATVEEVATGKAATPPPDNKPPMRPEDVARLKSAVLRYDHVGPAPSFAVGDAVRARALGAPGHTRLPAYVRGHKGVVEAVRGVHVLPDANAFENERGEPLYTVSFAASELWPEAAGSRDSVCLDMWESYLERV